MFVIFMIFRNSTCGETNQIGYNSYFDMFCHMYSKHHSLYGMIIGITESMVVKYLWLSSIWYTATCLVSRAIGGTIRFVVYQLTVGLTRSEKIFQGSHIFFSLVFQSNLFAGIGKLEVGGECTPHFFEKGYCPPTF